MAKEILIEIILKDRQASAKLKETAKATDQVKKSTDLYAKSIDDLTEEEIELLKVERDRVIQSKLTKKAIDGLVISEKARAAASKNGRAQSGLSNAILLETSRLASDASFGFTAIANNLSQVITLFQSFARTEAGGFIPAIRRLGASLLGSGGVLIAIQLLISFGPDLFKFFKGLVTNIDEEREALEKSTEEIRKNIVARKELLNQGLKDVRGFTTEFKQLLAEANISNIERQELILVELSERLQKLSVNNAKILKDETIDVGARLQIGEKLVEIEVKRQELEEKRAKLGLEVDDLKTAKERLKAFDENNKKIALSDEERLKFRNKLVTQVNVEKDQIKGLNLQIIQTQRGIKNLSKDIDTLSKQGVVLTPDPKKEAKDNLEQAKINTLDFSKEIIRANNFILKQGSSDRFAAIKFAGKQELELLESRKDRFIQKEKERFEAGSITEEQFNQTRLQAEEEYGKAAIAVKKANNAKLTKAEQDFYRAIAELSAQNNRNQQRIDLELDLVSENIEGKRVKRRLDLQQTQLDSQIKFNKNLLKDESLTEDKRQELISKTIRLEQQKTDIVRQLADAEAQAKVQSLEVVGNALTAFSSLAGKNSAAGKALAVSGALISTYLSAQKAFESQFSPIALVDSPVRGTIAAAAAVASGLANVKSILAVDSGGQSSAGGAQSNITATAPQFNVVGASQANQLATAIGPIASQETKVNLVYEDFKGVEDNVTKTNVAAGLG